jgi:hypothetical protein
MIESCGFGFPPSNYTLSGERPLSRRDYCGLSLTLSVVVVEHYPVMCLPQFVRPRGVGKESRVAPFAALRMQYRQPRLAGRVKALGRDLPEPARTLCIVKSPSYA